MPQTMYFTMVGFLKPCVLQCLGQENGVTMTLWEAQTRHAAELSPSVAQLCSVARLKNPLCETHTKKKVYHIALQ